MIKKHNNTSLLIGVPGFFLQIYGNVQGQPIILISGSILLLIGFSFYAQAKGRNPAWGFMTILSLIGLIVLVCLKDLTKEKIEIDTNCEQLRDS